METQGAVSSSVCQLMAKNIKKTWGSDYGLSLTGLAGPDKQVGDPPVGTVFIGFCGPQGEKTQKFFVETPDIKPPFSAREAIQRQSALLALDFLKAGIQGV